MKNRGKITKAKHAQFICDMKAHNSFLKSLGEKTLTYDEYVKYVFGYNKLQSNNKKEYAFSGSTAYSLRSTCHSKYKSLSTTCTNTTKNQPRVYTGTLIKGISTLHKSNAVPVISESEMHEHAAMRR
jgi:hypothetical protein